MPVLANPRQERFAQELAKGKTADEAYVLAGYKPDRGHASRMAAKGSISDRVTELALAGAKDAGVTVDRVLKGFADIAFAGEAEKTTDRLTALDRLGKHLGMFKVQIEQRHTHDFSGLSDDDLHALRHIVAQIEDSAPIRH